MKKSNKLLIALFLFIPASILFHNFLLGREFAKGNIQRFNTEGIKVRQQSLQPFRHVVYDGILWYKSGDNLLNISGEHQKLTLLTAGSTTPYFVVSPMLEKYLKIEQRNDTLFVSHEVKGQMMGEYYDDKSLKVYAPELSSITVRYAEIDMYGFAQDVPVKIHVQRSSCSIFGLSLPKLDLELEESAHCSILLNGRVDTLGYQLDKNASLTISNDIGIGAFRPGKIDSLATISLSGRAGNMSEVLKAVK
ncbi:hypothetical protein [Chitinophaga sp. XS-30]|uniref:hypothetical protein n=1 Tax=Chitinophaga sp. XS-30 TaxID=2604421 RepID=UPI0011DC7436|nr:hypothetical protein [Chitinophaga sp. XS-30]QEH43887.1 hypothetical protein FW415_24805 [Chitinophaga sp. XS-30]